MRDTVHQVSPEVKSFMMQTIGLLRYNQSVYSSVMLLIGIHVMFIVLKIKTQQREDYYHTSILYMVAY